MADNIDINWIRHSNVCKTQPVMMLGGKFSSFIPLLRRKMLCEADLAVGSGFWALVAACFALNARWLVIENEIVIFG